MVRIHRLVSLGVAASLLAPGVAPAQPQTIVMVPVPSPVSVVEHRIQAVADLDRTFAFYRDVIGLPVLAAPADAAELFPGGLAGTTGARVRAARFDLPGAGTGLVLAEFEGVERRPQRPRRSDPGESTLRVSVRELARVVAAAGRFGAPVASDESGEAGAAVLVDPDGFFVEVRRPALPPEGAAGGNVVGAHVAFTVAEPEPVAVFYRDVLGFSLERGATTGDRETRIVRIPGGRLAWEFTAHPGADRMAHAGRLQDPGTPAMAVRVPNVRVATEAARRAGLPILSDDGEPVMLEAGGLVLIRDPGGLLLELIERR
jgi:catechol 2,3-dioxygenase-like lactoylglutathione lyase family enzyme